MAKINILPAIDLRNGRCVRLLQGDYARQIDYADDPVAQAEQFVAAGAEWLHVVDLDGAREGRPCNLDAIERIIRATSLRVEVGGGIRDDATVKALFDVGAERAVIGTQALEDWEWFRAIAHAPGHANRIVLGLDAREGKLAVRGWTEVSDRLPVELAEAVADWPLGAINFTDIGRDGMLLGPNIEAIRAFAECSRVPVVASGGVTSIEDVRRLARLPITGIIIGRAIYEQQIDLAEAIQVAAAAV